MRVKHSLLVPIAYMLFIFALSSIPADEQARLGGILFVPPTVQNLLHIPLFGLLAVLWMRAFKNKGHALKKALRYTIIITVTYAAFDEFHQAFVPGRFASLTDILFDTIGCLGGVGCYRLTGSRL